MAAIKIKDYEIGFSDQFFFDTNVWLLLYGTIANFQASDQTQYATFLEKLIRRESPVFVTSMIISEFSNVILKRDFNQWCTVNNFVGKNFKKDFVGTQEYKNSVEQITILIKKIFNLPIVVKVGDNLNALNFDNILADFEIVDFNDAYYVELARISNYKIVTNDRDFQALTNKIDIISTQS